MKHSIVIITYNQEQYIEECLKAILSQLNYIYEIIISDDCSTDTTFDIITRYKNKYPQIIKAYQNERNIGIFPHLNKITQYITGDFVNLVAGDDLLPPDILMHYTNFIQRHKININDSIIIFTNSTLLYSNGNKKEISNYINKSRNPIDTTIADALYVWETGISAKLFKQFFYQTDIGYQADWLYHIERLFKCKQYYFLNETGYIYRVNTGVTAASKFKALQESKLNVIKILKNKYINQISDQSKKILQFDETWILYNQSPSLTKYIKLLIYFIQIQKILPKNSPIKTYYTIFIPATIRRIIKQLLKK